MKTLLNFLRGLVITLTIVILMGAAFAGGYWYRDQEQPIARFSLLDEAYSLLTTRGLKDPPPAPALEYGMIRGMLQAYGDPYSNFNEPAVHELQTDELEGKFGGIGVQLQKNEQGNWVLFPFPDGPAQKAGVLDGDILLAVDDLTVTNETSADVIQAAVRGPVGSRVRLKVSHIKGPLEEEISIKREEVTIPSVTWRLDTQQAQIGILKINLMAGTTADEIKRAVKDLQERGATHFILDLRDNPGGYLTAGIDVARMFLKEGVVLQEQYRGLNVETFNVDRPGPLADIPLAVLINHGSASASEIVAGALQAAKRAPLVGEPSYGKDTIQLVFELSDKSSLHLTAAHWWVPGLETAIGGNGLQPEIRVDPPTDAAGVDLVLQAAIRWLIAL
jgi:carboxyl-terminal processing protease